jgi:hypothetical protein
MPRLAKHPKASRPKPPASSPASADTRRARPLRDVVLDALAAPQTLSRIDITRMAKALESQGFGHIRRAKLMPNREDARRIASARRTEVRPTVVTENVETGTAETRSPDALAHALSEARARGAAFKQDLLADPGMLKTADMAARLGMSQEGVRLKWKRHELLGLEFAKRGIRYPSWQVFDNQRVLPALPRLFAILGGDAWTVYRFLLQQHPELSGARALDALRRGRTDAVIAAAENLASGAFA